MLITKDQTIAGFPAVEVRRLMRQMSGFKLRPEHIAEELRTSEPAAVVAERLAGEGLIAQTGSGEWESWEPTVAGMALAKARLGKPMPRAAAQRKLDSFLVRVREVNDDDTEPWVVKQVDLFGSFSDHTREMVGDVDLVVTFAGRPGVDVRQREDEIRREAARNGKRFDSIVDEIGFPLTLFQRRLRGVNQRLDIQFDHEQNPHRLPDGVVLVPVFTRGDQ